MNSTNTNLLPPGGVPVGAVSTAGVPVGLRYGPSQTPRSRSARRTGLCFLVCLIHIIFFAYLAYLLILLKPLVFPKPTGWYSLTLPIFFHLIFALFLMAFYMSAATDPGSVPAQYAFHMGDERKRRRYCKVCNVWKPDRTHHCSACNRCVLNMDHHCPWLNNCIGFENRKYFLQLLVYALTLSIVITVHGSIYLFVVGGELIPQRSSRGGSHDAAHHHLSYTHPTQEDTLVQLGEVLQCVVVCALTLFTFVLTLALVPFTKFHLKLVMTNSTTIESMDSSADPSRYDLGTVDRNCQQVFGRVPCCYGLPCDVRATVPVGDGVNWGEHYLRLAQNDEQRQWRGANRPHSAARSYQQSPVAVSSTAYHGEAPHSLPPHPPHTHHTHQARSAHSPYQVEMAQRAPPKSSDKSHPQDGLSDRERDRDRGRERERQRQRERERERQRQRERERERRARRRVGEEPTRSQSLPSVSISHTNTFIIQ